MARTRNLDAIEIRVLGALMEKEQTTPDYYPMTINAVIAACNQKTGRDPITALSETEVVEALDRLATDVLAWRSEGARSERWEHRLDRRWQLDGASKAIMTLLLLRGAQTAGELRARSERMHHFASVDEVDAVLRRLAGGDDALVRQLARQPGKREVRWAPTVGDAAVAESLEASVAATAPTAGAFATSPAPATPPVAPSRGRLEPVLERLGALEEEVGRLRRDLDALVARLGG